MFRWRHKSSRWESEAWKQIFCKSVKRIMNSRLQFRIWMESWEERAITSRLLNSKWSNFKPNSIELSSSSNGQIRKPTSSSRAHLHNWLRLNCASRNYTLFVCSKITRVSSREKRESSRQKVSAFEQNSGSKRKTVWNCWTIMLTSTKLRKNNSNCRLASFGKSWTGLDSPPSVQAYRIRRLSHWDHSWSTKNSSISRSCRLKINCSSHNCSRWSSRARRNCSFSSSRIRGSWMTTPAAVHSLSSKRIVCDHSLHLCRRTEIPAFKKTLNAWSSMNSTPISSPRPFLS